MTSDNIWMIHIPDNEVSQYYVNKVLPSWSNHEVNMFDAYTPDNMPNYLNFGKFWKFRDFSSSEKAGFYSHLELWKKCFEEDEPIAIIEHDVMCIEDYMPIKDNFFAFCDFDSEQSHRNYTERFRGHPYWGTQQRICPVTHAYYMTPDVAETMYYSLIDIELDKAVDDYMWEFMDRDMNRIVSYTTPVYDKKVGATISHE